MKFKKLSAIILSAAMCASAFSGCAQKSEVPLESSSVSESAPTSTSSSAPTSTATGTNESSEPLSGTSSESVSSSGLTSETPSSIPEQSSSQSSTQTETNSSSAHKHTYVSKTVAPTCAEVGYTIHTCSCGDQYTTDTVDALGHDCTKNVVSPTCTASGYTQYTCKRCGYTYKDDYTEALGHKYHSQTVAPTCTEDGYTLNICERCGEEHHDHHSHNAHHHGHDWSEWTVTKAATTSSEGEQQRKCSRCGETETQTIPRVETSPADYADEVIRLVNIERANNGLSPLSKRDDLTEYAQLRSTEIVSNFAHERPDGSSPLEYVRTLPNVRGSGENIAMGYGTPESVMNGWMNSPGHRRNILSQNFKSIGVGCYKSGGKTYWVQIFVS